MSSLEKWIARVGPWIVTTTKFIIQSRLCESSLRKIPHDSKYLDPLAVVTTLPFTTLPAAMAEVVTVSPSLNDFEA